jgi:hypothetical protein
VNALDLAARYRRDRRWYVVPLLPGTKVPGEHGRRTRGWQHQRIELGELAQHFTPDSNIGLLTGIDSACVDADVDAREALPLAAAWLPPTPCVFGRAGKRRSHYLYGLREPVGTQRWSDPVVEQQIRRARARDHDAARSAVLIEVRGDNAQTVLPGSTHPSGEAVCWENGGEAADPSPVGVGNVLSAAAKVAAGALLVRAWCDGGRHALTLPLARVLLDGGWTSDQASDFLEGVARAAGDEEWRERPDAIRTTVARLASGQPAQGFPSLADLIGTPRARKVVDWLDLRPSRAQPGAVSYRATDAGLVWDKPAAHGGTVPVMLTNFGARIVGDVLRDDGAEVRREFEVQAGRGQHLQRFVVPAAQFGSLGWVSESLGPQATVYAGMGLRDHARVAIQLLSERTSERRVYAHTGWRQVDGMDVYLHAAGGIGCNGAIADVEVDLPTRLAPASLPKPPDGAPLVEAVRASLRLLEVAPDRITVPLLGAVARAILGGADFSLHLAGPTGVGKSALAALAQQHWGEAFDAEGLPAAWSSTANALESLAFCAKDMLLVVDDYAPSGAQTDVQRLAREAERLLRAQGNLSARQRLGRNLGLVPARPPRGLILSSGEETPGGQSLRARLVVVEVGASDVNWRALTAAQRDAGDGLYAQACAAFIRWLAPRLDQARTLLSETVTLMRADSGLAGQHRRVPTAIGGLYAALACYLDFGRDAGALDDQTTEALRQRGRAALRALAQDQARHQASEEPCRRFLGLIESALASERAHLAGEDALEGVPQVGSPAGLGWRYVPDRDGLGGRWQPQGPRIGWITDDGTFLEPSSAYEVAAKLAAATGSLLTVKPSSLAKRLYERGLLASTELDSHGTYAIRRALQGHRRSVWHFSRGGSVSQKVAHLAHLAQSEGA